MRLNLLRNLAVAAVLVLISAVLSPSAKATTALASDDRPNIVFFVVDDLGVMDLGLAGSELYLTPNIDKLAASGVQFTQAYASHPRCVPSRYSMMTGVFPARDGVPGKGGKLKKRHTTVADLLAEAGYRNYFLGKWHLGVDGEEGGPLDQGFHVNIGGGAAGAPGSYAFPYQRDDRHHKDPIPGLEEGEPGEMLTDRLTDEAVALLQAHQRDQSGEPFFMMLSHYGVHTPLEDEAERIAQFEDRVASIDYAGDDFVDSDREGTSKRKQDDATYAAMISRVDDSLGRVVKTLDELGIADRTLIVFTSDHGGLSNRGLDSKRPLATSNLPYRAGKGHLLEGGIRVPMIAAWPGTIEAGSTSDFLTVGADHLPTFADLAGQRVPEKLTVDGVSYVSALHGETVARAAPVYWYTPRPRPVGTGDHAAAAVRDGDWKLVYWYDAGDVELFNLSTDPYEADNFAASDPDRAAALKSNLLEWLASVDAVDPKPFKKN